MAPSSSQLGCVLIAASQACDLCYRRKIKCDSASPLCSQCRIHGSECTYVAPRRKKAKRKVASISSSTLTPQLKVPTPRSSSSGHSSLGPSVPTDGTNPAPVDHVAEHTGHLELPESDITYSLIDTFLRTINRIHPLYDERMLLETANLWYRIPARRTKLA